MINVVQGYEYKGKVYATLEEAKKKQLSDDLHFMFQGHDVYSLLGKIVNSKLCREELVSLLIEYDLDVEDDEV